MQKWGFLYDRFNLFLWNSRHFFRTFLFRTGNRRSLTAFHLDLERRNLIHHDVAFWLRLNRWRNALLCFRVNYYARTQGLFLFLYFFGSKENLFDDCLVLILSKAEVKISSFMNNFWCINRNITSLILEQLFSSHNWVIYLLQLFNETLNLHIFLALEEHFEPWLAINHYSDLNLWVVTDLLEFGWSHSNKINIALKVINHKKVTNLITMIKNIFQNC